MCVCSRHDLKGLVMILRLTEDGGYNLHCQQCGRRLAREATLEAFELTKRGARRLLTEAAKEERMRAENNDPARRRQLHLAGLDPAPGPIGPLTTQQCLEMRLAGFDVPTDQPQAEASPTRSLFEELRDPAWQQRLAGLDEQLKYSFAALNTLLDMALRKKFGLSTSLMSGPAETTPYVVDLSPEAVFVKSGSKLLQIPYTITKTGPVELGRETEVTPRYVAVS